MNKPHESEEEDGEGPGSRLKEFLESLSEEAREFTRRKPLEGLLLSFVAGLLLGDLLRRNR
ncbi:MAG TPA: hypothetical protein VE981_07715 [Planctomycetota bacterium]|nr:hypothetical protein [Planctomycetota bacterium]